MYYMVTNGALYIPLATHCFVISYLFFFFPFRRDVRMCTDGGDNVYYCPIVEERWATI